MGKDIMAIKTNQELAQAVNAAIKEGYHGADEGEQEEMISKSCQ